MKRFLINNWLSLVLLLIMVVLTVNAIIGTHQKNQQINKLFDTLDVLMTESEKQIEYINSLIKLNEEQREVINQYNTLLEKIINNKAK